MKKCKVFYMILLLSIFSFFLLSCGNSSTSSSNGDNSNESTFSSNDVYSKLEYKFDENSDSYFVKGFQDEMLVYVNIPSEYRRKPVIGIDSYAFMDCTLLETVIMPNTITYLGESAFFNCKSLKNIQLSSGISVIPEGTFYNCSSLKKITIPEGVKTLGTSSFVDCTSLEYMNLPKSLEVIESCFSHGCYYLYLFQYAGTEKEWNNIKYGDNPFVDYVFVGYGGFIDKEGALDIPVHNAEFYAYNYYYSETQLIGFVNNQKYTDEIKKYVLSHVEIDYKEIALSYLNYCSNYSNFSRKIMRDHFKANYFSEEEIQYAFKNCNINWKEQAVKVADYYDYPYSFVDSPQKLKEVLDSEHYFSEEEINYALENSNIDWKQKAIDYINLYCSAGIGGSFLDYEYTSPKQLNDYLVNDIGFNEKDAKNAIYSDEIWLDWDYLCLCTIEKLSNDYYYKNSIYPTISYLKQKLLDYSFTSDNIEYAIENANFKLTEYSINYELNGGMFDSSENIVYSFCENEKVVIPWPVKTGYTFIGWKVNNSQSTDKNFIIQKGTTNNIELEANWLINNYTIELNVNSGETLLNNIINSEYNSVIELPIPKREGYDFLGWYDGELLVDNSYTVISDVSLCAKWCVKEYNISYDLDGGINNESNPNVYTIIDEIVLQNPTKDGYTFDGWTYSEQSEPTQNIVIHAGFKEELFFKAHWTANQYKIKYDPKDGLIDKLEDIVVFASYIELPVPEKTGYDFLGWYDGNEKIETGNWKINKNVTLTAKWQARSDISYVVNYWLENLEDEDYTLELSEEYQGTADKYVYAKTISFTGFKSPSQQYVKISADGSLVVDYFYTREEYYIKFVSNGGTSFENKKFKYQQQIIVDVPIRDNLTFGGWFTNASLTKELPENMPGNNLTLYAYWAEETKPNSFTFNDDIQIISGIDYEYFDSSSEILWVPAYIAGYEVTEITDYAFKNNTNLKKVVIPNTVTKLGLHLFYGCNSLEELTIPFVKTEKNVYDSLIGLGCLFNYWYDGSGYDHSLPEGMYDVQTYYYGGYTSSGSIGNKRYSVPNSLKKIVLTNTEIIPENSFYGFENLEEVIVVGTKVYIGEKAFYNCKSLLNVSFPNDITYEKNSFSGSSLSSIYS